MTSSATVSERAPAHGQHDAGAATASHRGRFWALALGSVGVVYGDIGTSPLYALKESLTAAAAGGAAGRETVFGVVSLVLWALIVVVTLKYVLLVMRMDNGGEGGTLSLMALVQRVMGQSGVFVIGLGMIGAALFYGDAVITPAISVLSAIEGLDLVTPSFHPYVLHISIAILVVLFAVQSRGTAAVAAWFGPIMVLWFAAIAIGGAVHIADQPAILGAVSPLHGIRFLLGHGIAGLVALGAVFLAVTGAEALYADMGHFGRKPIQFAWAALVLPALAVNYLGQGALILSDPAKLENPFFLLFPSWALLPMVILATLATIIASQAVITGAFSLTHQAMQLGLLPRFEVRPTSETEKGQIYIPRVNWMLLLAVVFLVGVFRSSSALASAYGIAVTGTMVVTAIMAYFVLRRCWSWSRPIAALVIAPFLVVDVVFLLANMLKIREGGWIPLLTGTALMFVMITWRKGARILVEKAHKQEVPLVDFIRLLEKSPPERVRGLAVFLTGSPDLAPSALLHNLKHNRVLHKHNVVLNVMVEDRPSVDPTTRATLERLSESFSRVTLRFGYMESPDVPKALRACRAQDWSFDIMQTSFFFSRRTLRPALKSRMWKWQDRLFISLARSASDVSQHFGIPTSRAVEVGSQITV